MKTTIRDHIEAEENKQSGNIILEREDVFQTTFEMASVGIVHLSPEGELLRANKYYCDMLGYSQKAILKVTLPH